MAVTERHAGRRCHAPSHERAFNQQMAAADRENKAALAAIEADTLAARRAQEKGRSFLNSMAGKLAAARSVLGNRADRNAVRALAASVDPWGAAEDFVPYYFKRKRSGGVCPICALPDRLKCTHKMVRALLQALSVTPENFFGGKGKGKDAAVLAAQAMHRAGFRHFATLDIVNCFQSVSPEALYHLPLPKGVISRHFDTRNLRFVHRAASLEHGASPIRDMVVGDNPSGPRGLMQGSPASNIILARLLRELPQSEDERVILYADNLLVAARDPDGLRAMIKTLADFFRQFPGSPLDLCEPTFADCGCIDFLGYRLSQKGSVGLADSSWTRLGPRLDAARLEDEAARRQFPLAVWQTVTVSGARKMAKE